jgi:acyl carrier protein
MGEFKNKSEILIHKAIELKVQQAVHQEIHRLLSERDTSVLNIAEECHLQADLGFTSVELVNLISALDANLRVDLFAQNISIADLGTVGDLSQAYQKSLFGLHISSANTDEMLLASRRRAQARRNRRDL